MSTWALDQLQQQLPDAVVKRYHDRTGAEWAVVSREAIVRTAQLLKGQLGFKLFISMDCVDRLQLPESTPRFEVVYFLFNLERNEAGSCTARPVRSETSCSTWCWDRHCCS